MYEDTAPAARGVSHPVTGSVEDTLGAVIPRRAARLLLLEVHGWRALLTLFGSRSRKARPGQFAYASGLRMPMAVLLGLTLVEIPIFTGGPARRQMLAALEEWSPIPPPRPAP